MQFIWYQSASMSVSVFSFKQPHSHGHLLEVAQYNKSPLLVVSEAIIPKVHPGLLNTTSLPTSASSYRLIQLTQAFVL